MGWRIAVATVIGFSGSAFGTVGGVGGGGIFVPMLNLIVGFDTKSSAALSKCKLLLSSPPPTPTFSFSFQPSEKRKKKPCFCSFSVRQTPVK